MLYEPSHFRLDDRAAALEIARAHPLATIVSTHDGEVDVTHAPLVPREADGRLVLLGHMARANPHWRAWEQAPVPVTAIFHGPDAYVSPSSYTVREAVPTWNYIVVHARGVATITHDGAAKERILKALIDAHDPPYRGQWDDELSEAYRERQKAHIVGFEIAVETLSAKFKLSQNRPAADRAGVLAAMDRGACTHRALARWMRRLAPPARAQTGIRPVTAADTAAVIALWRTVFPEYDDPVHAQRDPRANIERKLAFGDGLFWLAERAGERGPEVIGSAMAGYDGHRGWLYSLGVAPVARRQGVGTRLLAHAEQALRARGCPKINLQVFASNTAAPAFWRARGYAHDAVTGMGKPLA